MVQPLHLAEADGGNTWGLPPSVLLAQAGQIPVHPLSLNEPHSAPAHKSAQLDVFGSIPIPPKHNPSIGITPFGQNCLVTYIPTPTIATPIIITSAKAI